MLRIKLASGEETVYRTVAELALGIQNGVVTSRALIYHQRSEKWIPVTVHPAYKTALEGGSALAARAAAPTTAVEELPAPPQPRPAAAGPKPVMPSRTPPPPPIATPAQRVAAAPKVEAATPPPPQAPTPPLPPAPAPPVAIAPLLEVEPPAPAPPKAPTPPLPPVPAPPVAIAPLPEVEPQAPAPPKASTPSLPPVPAPPVTIAPPPTVETPIQGLLTDNGMMGLERDEAPPAKAEPVSGADAPKPAAAAPPSGDELPQLLLTSEISLTEMTTRRSGPNPMVVEPPRPRTSGPVEVHHAAHAPRRTRKPPIALTAALVLIAVAALATWGLLRSPSAPASVDSTATTAPASHPAVATAPTHPEATTPPALPPDSLVRRYASAQDSARAEFDTALVRIHFGRLLVAERLGSLDSLKLAHQVITTAAGVLGAYRAKGAAIDQFFQDSANALAQRQAWSGSDLAAWKARPSRLESPEMARLTDSLLANVDGVYQVLTKQMGQYDYTPASIAFLDPESMQKYAGYRSWLTRRVGALNGVPSAKLSPVLATVLRAVGSVNLPAAFAKEPVIPNAPDLPKDSGN